MKQLKTISFHLLMFLGASVFGQTSLSKGEIAIISISTGDEYFAFVTLVDLAAGTEIYFTDEEADGDLSIGTGEGTVLYTAPVGGVTAGAVITGTSDGSATNFSSTADGSMVLGNSGDGILAYQGSSVGNVTTFLHAIGEDGGDLGSFPASTLSSGDIVQIGNDDGNYTGDTAGTAAALISAINDASNWTVSGSASISPPASFSVSGAGPTVGFDASSSSANETNATFSVNLDVSLTNYDAQVVVDVAVSGGTAEGADYNLNTTQLTFNSAGTQQVSIDIIPDAGYDDESIIVSLTLNSGTADISPSSHTITIVDDESAPVPTLLITEVSDPQDQFSGRFVEIYNYGSSSVDLSTDNIYFTVQVNGGTSTNSTGLTGSLAAGDILIIGNSTNVQSNYGYAADVDYGSVNGNGDDSYHIYYGGDHTSGTLLDSYGVLGVDGSGEDWEYVDSRAVRNSPKSTLPNTTWTLGEWTISSANIADMTPGALENEFRYDGDWKPSNANGSISSSDDVVIISSVSTTADWQSNNVEVRSGATFAIAEGNEIELSGNLSNEGTVLLDASASGYAQLKVNGSLSGSGSITVEQYFANSGWHNLGLPLDVSSLDVLGDVGDQAGSGAQNTFYWDASAGSWVNQTASNADVAGRGYMVFVGTYGIASAPAIISISGTPYTSHTPSLNYGASNNQDWNLIANPFTCSLDFDAINVDGAGSNVNNAFSIWDPSANAGAGNYVEFSSISPSTQEIAPMQAFWVQTTGSNPSFPAMSVASHGTVSSTPTYYKSQNVIADRFFLHTYQASDLHLNDDLLFGMVQGATDGMDNAYDAGARIGNNVAPHLMSVTSGKEMSINAFDYSPNHSKEKTLQLRFVSGKQGEVYFIELKDSLLSNNYNIYLEDLKERKLFNLNNKAYKFVHDQNAEYRFKLHISPSTTVNSGHTHISVGIGTGISGGTLVLKLEAPSRDLEGELIDLNGRVISHFVYPSGAEEFRVDVSNYSKGIYLMKLYTEQGEEVQKILIQ